MKAARARYATKAAIERAVTVARQCGITPGGIELAPDGTIRIIHGPESRASDYDRWRDKL